MCPKERNENFFSDICDFPIPSYEQWKIAVEKSLKGVPFATLTTKTYEDITLQPMYQKRDIANLSFVHSLPGEFPYVRGTEPLANQKSWLVAQEINHPLPETVNEWLKNDLQKGVNAINLVLNEDIKVGTNGNVCTLGTSIYTLEDIETIFKDIELDHYPFMMQCGTNVAILALIVSYFKKKKFPITRLRGCIGIDPLAMLLNAGTLRSGINSYLDQMAEIIRWKEEEGLDLKTIFIDGSPYHNSGASGVQELAFMLATGVYYIRELQNRGLTIDQIGSSISFSISIGSNLFMELAKVRSARMLWSNIIEAFGGKAETQKLTIHARTSKWTKTVYDPHVNMLRGTVEAFTAAVSGIDSLHVSPFDEAYMLPSDLSRRAARNIQLIIQEEALITITADPAGGSWYVEHLTNEIATKSWTLFQEVEEIGGIYEAIIKGVPQQLVKQVSKQKKEDIEKRKLSFVGATMYPNNRETFKESPNDALKNVIEQRMQSLKQKQAVVTSISTQNMMNDMVSAFAEGATVAEIIASLGNGQEISVEKLETYRATEAFEKLRQRNDQKKLTGKPMKVFLTSIGPLSHHKQRSDFIASFFETGGYQVIKSNGFETSEEAIKATIHSGATIAVICGKNERYHELSFEIVTNVKRDRPDIRLFVAGKQEAELQKQLIEAGLDGFIHIGTNCYQLLNELQGEGGKWDE
ncbi:MAG: methylmalonyl-CoA mutase family protein [Anaerobacillus sp.]|uniref:methylmalonyl-CoA mutase family protein n=1 Tax=Anaerobacillus sp. TaxID=1872506 RepID=UPI00391B49DC